MNAITAIFLGPQGCGKGTQAAQLKAYLAKTDPARAALSFGMGNALREFIAAPGYTQDIVRPSMERGELQPLFLAASLLGNFLVEKIQSNEHLLVDGWPREENQIEVLDSAISFYNRQQPVIIFLNISDDTALERLVKRGRSDDTPEIISERLAWSRERLGAILDWYRKNPRYAVVEINGERDIGIVQTDVRAAAGL
jgi:adenylate kinase